VVHRLLLGYGFILALTAGAFLAAWQVGELTSSPLVACAMMALLGLLILKFVSEPLGQWGIRRGYLKKKGDGWFERPVAQVILFSLAAAIWLSANYRGNPVSSWDASMAGVFVANVMYALLQTRGFQKKSGLVHE
jgi:hypothetical protein